MAWPTRRCAVRDVSGFEFEILDNTGRRWVRLMGAGGLMGDGVLCALNRPGADRRVLPKIKERLLHRARVHLQREGSLLVLRSWDLPPSDRFQRVTAARVLSVREVCRA